LLAHGRWFSPSTPASSTTKTGCHDIAESGAKTPKIKIKYFISKIGCYETTRTIKKLNGYTYFP
jgi:hypothetical protein